jgi:hypothetical protein
LIIVWACLYGTPSYGGSHHLPAQRFSIRPSLLSLLYPHFRCHVSVNVLALIV